MWFIVGILVGAVTALLYAPKSGDITREELRQRTDELKRRADELQRVAQRMADEAQVKGRELVDEAKRQWDRTGGKGPEGTSKVS
ncbi:MAG TPA: YtxH domain-containing protein [Candidatus Limnocylindrales bacterium]|nr:YtxH domain-containing protein [Candidatus Limnocylindrales bacterium]